MRLILRVVTIHFSYLPDYYIRVTVLLEYLDLDVIIIDAMQAWARVTWVLATPLITTASTFCGALFYD